MTVYGPNERGRDEKHDDRLISLHSLLELIDKNQMELVGIRKNPSTLLPKESYTLMHHGMEILREAILDKFYNPIILMTTKPTRTQMLDAINMKIASLRIIQDRHTGLDAFIEDVMIGDVLDWIEKNSKNTQNKINSKAILDMNWRTKREPLHLQDDECVSFIYNLISNDNK